MITFTPLSGGARSLSTTPLAYVLQVDDVRILLDCGSPDWNLEQPESEHPWEAYCQAVESCAPSIDLVLLSHGDLAHAGLFPFAQSHWGLNAPTYTTLPVQAMARIAVVEEVEDMRAEEDVDIYEPTDSEPKDVDDSQEENPRRRIGKRIATVNQVHEAFDSITTLRYSQPTHLSGKCQGLTITPFAAGHTLGGTIWKIRSPSAGTLVYAVDLNHMRERHLDGTVLLRAGPGASAMGGVFEPLARPDLLITDAERALVIGSRRKDRDKALLDIITSTLRGSHSILLPTDSSARLLELLVLFDQHWAFSKLRAPICLISKTGKEMLTFVRSMMEWLGGTISKEDVGENVETGHKRKRNDDDDEDGFGALALRFKHLEFFVSPAALLDRYPSSMPKLILAVPPTLSHGPSRALFSDFASVNGNVVLLTSRGEPGTLTRALFDRWNDAQGPDNKWDQGKLGEMINLDGILSLKMNSKVPLAGAELESHLQRERAIKEKAAAQKAALARTQRLLEADEGDSDSDESDTDREDEEVEEVLGNGDESATGGALTTFVEPGGGPGGRGSLRRLNSNVGTTVDWGTVDTDGDGNAKQLSFDIYLKGNVSKTTSFFKTTAGQTQRFRMFPFVERRRRVDAYGETIDVGAWLRKGKALDEDAESEEVKEAKRRKLEEGERKKTAPEPPSKFLKQDVQVDLRCRLQYIDMEGLNDGRAVKNIVPQVNPRKMILVHASSDATDSLLDSWASIRAMTRDIFTPNVGETVQIGQHTNSFAISLGDDFLSTLKMSRFEDSEIGFVRGRIGSHPTSSLPTLQPISASAVAAMMVDHQSADSNSLAITPLPPATMIGDLKLTALKTRLAALGISAEFAGGGVLVCGGVIGKQQGAADEMTVAVRKTGRGKVLVEGSTSEVYYIVRREIYGLHALVEA